MSSVTIFTAVVLLFILLTVTVVSVTSHVASSADTDIPQFLQSACSSQQMEIVREVTEQEDSRPLAISLVISFIVSFFPSAAAVTFLLSLLPAVASNSILSIGCEGLINREVLIPHSGSLLSSTVASASSSLSSSPMFLSSFCSFMFLLIFLIVTHESSDPLMLPPAPKPLKRQSKLSSTKLIRSRLGHRVGEKRGRKLSAVREEDDDREEETDSEDQLEQPQPQHQQLQNTAVTSIHEEEEEEQGKPKSLS